MARASGIAGAIAITVGAIALAIPSWMSASDRITARLDHPERVYFGGNAAAQAAFERLAANDPQAALPLARHAVRTAPIDPSSTSALASTYLALDRPNDAYAAFAVAGGLGWRDVPTQLYWLGQAAAVGDVDVLAQRLDALLRLRINNEVIENSLNVLAQSSVGQQALATLLIQNPPWASRFLAGTSALEGEDLAGRIKAIELAAANRAPIDCDAIGVAAIHLIRQDQPSIARDFWRRTCGQNENGLVFNGDFEADSSSASQSPFVWQLRPRAGLDVAMVPAPRPLRGNALKISSSRTVRTVAADQFMALRPGRYRLSWTTALDNGRPDSSIIVLVRCEGAPTTIDVSPVQDGANRNDVTAMLEVPSQGCPLQRIAIQKAASGLQGNETGWIDDIGIEPIGIAAANATP